MLKRVLTGCCIVLLCACGASKKEVMQSVKDNNLLQEKVVSDYVFRLQYMPQEEKGADTSLLYFRLNVSNNNGTPLKGTNDLSFSYGLDTLFSIVNATDTISPLDINRIANGTINGAEYMLVFDKQRLYALPEFKVLFRDWLFTHQYISFPVSGEAIAHIDSLSLNI
ncbi:hypothetical protein SAMN05428949_0396 [Chitinophaga sp. YR627]|uniref:hypothetical protein n=1 Tax=Chitinophaga sp. YR627 TaxID=1881041 RepID=UPI0008EC549C|nr:hypothetical protein [Chitinophaga sp. YR627]SFM67544.1 hypothetical protein SAMN05428949_0396 [Chitinophaga sp. YR627]